MNVIEIIILLAIAGMLWTSIFACLTEWNNQRRHKEILGQQAKLIEAIACLSELVTTYGDAHTQFDKISCHSHALILTPLQFLLFSVKEHMLRTEQYEGAKDIDNLITLIQDAIKSNQ